MSENEFLAGQILVSQPKNQVGPFSKSVVLIAEQGLTGAWGVIVNRPSSSVSMKDVMLAVGIESPSEEIVYIGGPVEPVRVQVIHTMDWFSPSTLKITDEIGITGDVSILSAISTGQGPRLYRAGVGLSVWSAGQLEGEQSGIDPWNESHKWLVAPANIELCLTGAGDEQWQRAINQCVNKRISDYF